MCDSRGLGLIGFFCLLPALISPNIRHQPYRPHGGLRTHGMTPIEKLHTSGLNCPDTLALIPRIILNPIAGPIVTQGGAMSRQSNFFSLLTLAVRRG